MNALDTIISELRSAGTLVHAPVDLPPITGVADDSRRVGPGHLFCAVKGTTTDGHDFISEATKRGATAVVVTKDQLYVSVPQILVGDDRMAAAIAAREWYRRPATGLRVVAVTGTNGKTTSVSLIRHILNTDGAVGSIGTLGAVDGSGNLLPGHDRLTTPGAVELQEVLAELRGRGCRTMVMEASSHALHQDRLAGVPVEVALFTNLTHEHLDYHVTLEQYRAAKLRLLDLLEPGGTAVCNADDAAWSSVVVGGGRQVMRFATEQAGDVRVHLLSSHERGSEVEFSFGSQQLIGKIQLPGAFNLSNAAGAAAASWAAGASPAVIVDRLGTAPQVPGRMERLAEGAFVVLRDYAHTPDALERLLAALRPVTAGRLVVLFGAGGDRDRAKRPRMGAIAERLADVVVVTSDNPRTEDPERIIDDVVSGMRGTRHRRIVDRADAIRTAVGELGEGDCLVLAGKGHETYQAIGTRTVPFDEREIVHHALRPSR